MTLGNKDDPVVVIWEQEGEVERKSWVENDKVVAYIDCGHRLRDLASTQV